MNEPTLAWRLFPRGVACNLEAIWVSGWYRDEFDSVFPKQGFRWDDKVRTLCPWDMLLSRLEPRIATLGAIYRETNITCLPDATTTHLEQPST